MCGVFFLGLATGDSRLFGGVFASLIKKLALSREHAID
jgi:hypothetical protein